MKAFTIAILGILAYAMVIGEISAQPVASKPVSPQTNATNIKRILRIGILLSADLTGKKIIIKARTGQDTIPFNSSTRIKTLEKTNSIADITVGNRVAILYSLKDKQKMALKITEMKPPKAEDSH